MEGNKALLTSEGRTGVARKFSAIPKLGLPFSDIAGCGEYLDHTVFQAFGRRHQSHTHGPRPLSSLLRRGSGC